MSETPVTPAPPAAPAQDGEAQEPEQKVDTTDWKAKAREWESRAKANKTAADKLAELEESQKSEAEKAAGRAKAAEDRAVAAELRATRSDVAIEFGLSKEHAAGLEYVTSEEGMRAVAALLKGADTDRKKSGNYVPGEGTTPNVPEGEERATVRGLFSPN